MKFLFSFWILFSFFLRMWLEGLDLVAKNMGSYLLICKTVGEWNLEMRRHLDQKKHIFCSIFILATRTHRLSLFFLRGLVARCLNNKKNKAVNCRLHNGHHQHGPSTCRLAAHTDTALAHTNMPTGTDPFGPNASHHMCFDKISLWLSPHSRKNKLGMSKDMYD